MSQRRACRPPPHADSRAAWSRPESRQLAQQPLHHPELDEDRHCEAQSQKARKDPPVLRPEMPRKHDCESRGRKDCGELEKRTRHCPTPKTETMEVASASEASTSVSVRREGDAPGETTSHTCQEAADPRRSAADGGEAPVPFWRASPVITNPRTFEPGDSSSTRRSSSSIPMGTAEGFATTTTASAWAVKPRHPRSRVMRANR